METESEEIRVASHGFENKREIEADSMLDDKICMEMGMETKMEMEMKKEMGMEMGMERKKV